MLRSGWPRLSAALPSHTGMCWTEEDLVARSIYQLTFPNPLLQPLGFEKYWLIFLRMEPIIHLLYHRLYEITHLMFRDIIVCYFERWGNCQLAWDGASWKAHWVEENENFIGLPIILLEREELHWKPSILIVSTCLPCHSSEFRCTWWFLNGSSDGIYSKWTGISGMSLLMGK